ncbi:unnamed protein product [Protopolystoma xenopodis]|uniref:Uncharacterized protein n=1 Tax=Protopolystoma xenopodis TaxID=117903 RepID=A0A448WI74_9PLAT|nr:unnamed protein product [Protopolystoma xenopodis]
MPSACPQFKPSPSSSLLHFSQICSVCFTIARTSIGRGRRKWDAAVNSAKRLSVDRLRSQPNGVWTTLKKRLNRSLGPINAMNGHLNSRVPPRGSAD